MGKLRVWKSFSAVMVLLLVLQVGILTIPPGSALADNPPPATTPPALPIVVTFLDANLEAVIREAISKPTGNIYASELASLTTLEAGNRGIVNLLGLEYCTNLTKLYLYSNRISNLTPLSGLTSLQELGLVANQISNIEPLRNLNNLYYLALTSNKIISISTISYLTNLTQLHLHNNQISDISPLSNLTKIWNLTLDSNHISNIQPLSSLPNLQYLYLASNQISDISPLSNLINLKLLGLSSNQITDVSHTRNLVNLESLDLHHNQITDIEPLVNNPGLSASDDVYLKSNPLSATSVNVYIPTLQARGAKVEWDTLPPYSTPPTVERRSMTSLQLKPGEITTVIYTIRNSGAMQYMLAELIPDPRKGMCSEWILDGQQYSPSYAFKSQGTQEMIVRVQAPMDGTFIGDYPLTIKFNLLPECVPFTGIIGGPSGSNRIPIFEDPITLTISNTPPPTPPTLPDQIITVPVGVSFTISVSSNPSTGYSWEAVFDPSLLKLIKRYTPPNSGQMGASGVENFEFEGMKPGNTNIYLNYKRPFEPNNPSLKRETFNVVILAPTPTPWPTINSYMASPSSITTGAYSTLSWSVSNAKSVTIDNGVGTVSSSGSRTVIPSTTTTYTLLASNGANTVAQTATVNVTTAPPPPTPPPPVTTPPVITPPAPPPPIATPPVVTPPAPPPMPPTTGTSLVAASMTATPNGVIQVPIRLNEASNIGSMNFVLTYNPQVLKVNKIDTGALLSGALFMTNYKVPPLVRFGLTTSDGISGSGTMAYIEFQVIGAAGSSSALTFSALITKNTSGQAVAVTSQNGMVTVATDGKVKGDYNGDGKVTIVDVMAALKMSIQLLPEDLILDMDGDGQVTAADAQLILKIALGK